MTNDEKMAKEFIDKTWPRKGPCLVPIIGAVNKSSLLLTSHENDYCQCDVNEAYLAGIKAERERSKKLIYSLETISNYEAGSSITAIGKFAKEMIQEYEKGE